MKHYRVTCLFLADWPFVVTALFGDRQPSSSQIGGNMGIFNFDEPIVPNDLGPLVIIESAPTPYQFQ